MKLAFYHMESSKNYRYTFKGFGFVTCATKKSALVFCGSLEKESC